MEMGTGKNLLHHLIFLISAVILLSTTTYSIGVNYGTLANNLPPPSQVANFLKTQTIIDRIKIFDANPDILRGFAGSNISVTVTLPNGDIPSITNPRVARRWIANNILPFHPATQINRILVGNEIIHSRDANLINNLVPAMKSLHAALVRARLSHIQVTTPHSLGILTTAFPPSMARFHRGLDRAVFAPMLQFLRQTRSPFMANPYPYFGYSPKTLNYALFKRNRGMRDRFTGITYTNMFDAFMDAVHSAMKALGYGDVPICVGETGWPSLAEPFQPEINAASAAAYNGNLFRHASSRRGTPLMPNRRFEIFIFALFNENLKPGPTAERNFGLFRPDLTPVYDIGIMRGSRARGRLPRRPALPRPAPSTRSGKTWCVAKSYTNDAALQKNIDYVCSLGVDCKPIQAGGACYNPNNVRSHASFVMNAHYQRSGRQVISCDFAHTGVVTSADPSRGTCKYI